MKERLREKLELDKRALQVVERLLEDSVAEDFLVDCAKFITRANYKDVIEERSIAKLCGYPICPSKLGKIPTQQYKISTKSNKVYDITERKCFCSNFCYKASKEFELQISQTPLWLRQHESPPKITLRKKGDGGSSGEEVILTHRRLYEKEIEDPLASLPEDRSQQRPTVDDLNHSDGSDTEQEQDFVSSVVPQRQGPRVHWGDLPKRTDVDKNGRKLEKRNRREKGDGAEAEGRQDGEGKEREEEKRQEEKTETGTDAGEQKRSEKHNAEQEGGVDEATAKLNACTLSETVAAPLSADSTQTDPSTHPKNSKPSTQADPDSSNKARAARTRVNTSQVGASRRGAAVAQPDALRLNLLEFLKRTLKDWSTDATLHFLYGPGHSPGPAVTGAKDADEKEEEEELDGDDEDAEAAGVGQQKRASAAVPDYGKLREEGQKTELRVREFYKGTWVVPEGEEKQVKDKQATAQAQSRNSPVLPLVDSSAQHLIQKRIVVDKLSSCLRNIVGPLRLTMNGISTDLNNLVRTFRFTSTNIIHKTPEWTLIALVLLHLLSQVSPLVRDALETPSSVEYLNTLTKALGLQEQDLLNVARLLECH